MSSSSDQVGVGLYLVPLDLQRGFHIKGTIVRFCIFARCALSLLQVLSPEALLNAPVNFASMTY